MSDQERGPNGKFGPKPPRRLQLVVTQACTRQCSVNRANISEAAYSIIMDCFERGEGSGRIANRLVAAGVVGPNARAIRLHRQKHVQVVDDVAVVEALTGEPRKSMQQMLESDFYNPRASITDRARLAPIIRELGGGYDTTPFESMAQGTLHNDVINEAMLDRANEEDLLHAVKLVLAGATGAERESMLATLRSLLPTEQGEPEHVSPAGG
jgi:hypothetical protein